MSVQRVIRARPANSHPLPLSLLSIGLQGRLLRPTSSQHFRFQSSNRPSEPDSPNATKPAAANPVPATDKQASRLDRILTRTQKYLPQRFHGPLSNFRSAPFSHVSAFLLLHELTAVASIGLLMAWLYYFDIVPFEFVFGPWAGAAHEQGLKLLRWARKKGWFGLDKQSAKDGEERLEQEVEGEMEKKAKEGGGGMWFQRWEKDSGDVGEGGEMSRTATTMAAARKVKEKIIWDKSEAGYKIGIQLFAAYAVTKMLVIPRIALSIWLTPPTARMFILCKEALQRSLKR